MGDGADGAPRAPEHDTSKGAVALLILDMINSFDFPRGEVLASKALTAAEGIVKLRRALDQAGVPIIYVNDNFGEWHSERSRLIETAIGAGSAVARRLRPDAEDYFIIKPKFSGFYATNLAVLLPKLGVSRLILTGVATDICVLFTAADAHMRDYALWVPADLVAAEDERRGEAALQMMAHSMGAETAPSDRLDVATWLARLENDAT